MIDLNSTSVRWTITLNRPDKANAINMEMLIRLNEILDEAKQQLKLGRAVITTEESDLVSPPAREETNQTTEN